MSEPAQHEAETPLWFALPPCFHELPLDADGIERTRQMLRERLGEPNEQHSNLALAAYDLTIEALRDQNAVYFGIAVMQTDAERITHATLTVLLHGVPVADRKLAVAGLERALRATHPGDAVRLVRLPCGPAVTTTREHTFTAEQVEGIGPADGGRVRSLQYTVPLPDGRRTATFELSTTCLAEWDDYRDIIDGIMCTVTFENPEHAIARERQTADVRERIHDALNPDA